jgi:hypothetical protein
MYTQDKVHYLPDEMKLVQAAGGEVPPAVHWIKKLFNGEIVEERR